MSKCHRRTFTISEYNAPRGVSRNYGAVLNDDPLPIRPSGGYTSVIVANLLVAVVLVVAMLISGTSVVTAIITSSIYYAVVTITSLLILSGTLAVVLLNRQEQQTAREVYRLQYQVERPRLLPADPLPTPSEPPALPGNFVPALAPTDVSARREAAAWGMQLYGPDGLPDPKKIVLSTDREPPGRLRIAAPRGDARQWLMDRRVLVEVRRGLAVNLTEYPTIEEFRQLL